MTTQFQYEVQTLRGKGPRINVRIPGLLNYLAAFNGAKTYQDPTRISQTVATAPFVHIVESTPRKTVWTRFKAKFTQFRPA